MSAREVHTTDQLELCACSADLVHTVTMDDLTGHGVATRLPIDSDADAVDAIAETFAGEVAQLLEECPGSARWAIRCTRCGALHAYGRID